MTRALAHRGPDDEGFHEAPGIALGHRRLAVRDPGPAGHQPFADPAGEVVVVFNGELYNDGELRSELSRRHGIRFRTRCDTELLPLGFRVLGPDLFARLEGIFAVALWDARARALYLARDGAGVKPLFTSGGGPRWRFASELKALLEDPEQPEQMDGAALHAWLAQGYVAPDRTLLTGVGQLAPGTVRRISGDGVRDVRFWQPVRKPDIRRLDDAVDAVAATLPPVVEQQLVSDVPVGVLQSGGIDSTLLTFTLRGRERLPVFTARFEEPSHDESARATRAARAAGVEHHLVPVAGDDVGADFEAMVRHFDGQVADSSGLAFYALARAVRRHTVVVLSGDGADELFAGYPTYRATRLAARLAGRVPSALLEAARRLGDRLARGSETRLPAAAVLARFAAGLAEPGIGCHAAWRRLWPAAPGGRRRWPAAPVPGPRGLGRSRVRPRHCRRSTVRRCARCSGATPSSTTGRPLPRPTAAPWTARCWRTSASTCRPTC